MSDLPRTVVATDAEALKLIDCHALSGRGAGYIDIHLLAEVRLTAGAELWRRDKRQHGVAAQPGLAKALPPHRVSSGYSAGIMLLIIGPGTSIQARRFRPIPCKVRD